MRTIFQCCTKRIENTKENACFHIYLFGQIIILYFIIPTVTYHISTDLETIVEVFDALSYFIIRNKKVVSSWNVLHYVSLNFFIL